MGISMGLGLTNNCDLDCPHCYRPQGKIYNLTLQDVKTICENLEVGSVGLGTGENGMNPDYFKIIEYFRDKEIPVTLASNGYTVETTPDEILKTFRDVEFSIDFPSEEEQDNFRGKGNWKRILTNMKKCRNLGLDVSILAVLMNLNYNKLGELARFAASLDCNFRVNVFQPVQNKGFIPTYDQYWEAFNILFQESAVVSCTEPLVNTFSGLNTIQGSPCARRSIRVTPLKQVLPCVYWPENNIGIEDLLKLKEKVWEAPPFQNVKKVPEACKTCQHLENCQGGCRSRNLLLGKDNEPDLYCPVKRGDSKTLNPTLAVDKKLLRAKSICTTIVKG
jgi:radical SAM protein with 4Fe4S-binding SPASM domain